MSTLTKVAREAKVAVSTVSLLLNHRERVKPETRARIEQAIQRVGYRPKRRKEIVKREVSLRLAFIYTADTATPTGGLSMSGYCREVIAGMQESMAGTASSLSIFRGFDHVEQDSMVMDQVNAREFDGAVLFGAGIRSGYQEKLLQSGLPLVVLNRLPEDGQFSCVTCDYLGGGRRAIEHLHSLGHRRIAVAIDDDPGKWLVKQICKGATLELKDRSLEPIFVESGGLNIGSEEALEQFCRRLLKEKATALFTGDNLAVRCADALLRMGVSVPNDMSIIGFDDRGFVAANGLPMTSIGYDKRRMGKLAVQMLVKLFNSRGKLKWLGSSVSTYLVKGKTTTSIAVESTQKN